MGSKGGGGRGRAGGVPRAFYKTSGAPRTEARLFGRASSPRLWGLASLFSQVLVVRVVDVVLGGGV